MINLGVVFGSKDQAKPLIVGKDTVYVHTDIIKVGKDSNGKTLNNLYQYVEIQYTKDEYIQLISEKNAKLNEQFTELQLALCDVFESLS